LPSNQLSFLLQYFHDLLPAILCSSLRSEQRFPVTLLFDKHDTSNLNRLDFFWLY
jgi:hypothetical protein